MSSKAAMIADSAWVKSASSAVDKPTCAGHCIVAVAPQGRGSDGDVAQLGERYLRTVEAGGSNPLISTIGYHVEATSSRVASAACA